VSCHENLHHDNADAAVAGIADGSTILIGGFGMAGMPVTLIDALIRQGATELIVVNNNAGNGETGLAALLAAGRVRKMICSFPRRDSYVFDRLYRDGKIELELVPQGNLAERMRAAGAGIGAFYSPTGSGTPLAEGRNKERSTGATTCWSTRSKVTWPSSARTSVTGWATWCTARPHATSDP